MKIDSERQLGRAKNAVLNFLEHHLSIPKIYIDADWDGQHVDVLAINRDGVGDIYAALVFECLYGSDGRLDYASYQQTINHLLDRFSTIPAHYKYIGAIGSINYHPAVFVPGASNSPVQMRSNYDIPPSLIDKSFSSDGLGRVGLLAIGDSLDQEPQVHIDVKPERFRAKIAKLADEYVQQHEADWEIRA